MLIAVSPQDESNISSSIAPMISPQKPVAHPNSQRPPIQTGEVGFSSAHLVGICGSGMKALAELLCDLGCSVSGSDLQPASPIVQAMEKRGLRVHRGHDDHFLPRDVGVLVYSPAVGEDNPERQLAARLGIPQFSYSQMLGLLMEKRIGISVAGTHGKSTTTALCASILSAAGLSPSVVVGAELTGRNTSGWAGDGDLFLVESCEYQQSFLDLHPKFAVVTGVEADHFDCYADLDQTKAAFSAFAQQVQPDGLLLVKGDCPAALEIARAATAEVVTFSLNGNDDWWAADLRRTSGGTRFRLFYRNQFFSEITLQLPGRHNVMNALAAAALCHHVGVSAFDIRNGLREFTGLHRRFEQVGSWRGVTLIDDYAHHPTAVRETLRTLRENSSRRRIWCAFQPHQISRTRSLMKEFSESFSAADQVLIAPTFAAREQLDRESVEISRELADLITRTGQPARFCPSLDHMIATLEDETRPGDVLITMGAGDIDQVHHEFTRRLQRNHATG